MNVIEVMRALFTETKVITRYILERMSALGIEVDCYFIIELQWRYKQTSEILDIPFDINFIVPVSH